MILSVKIYPKMIENSNKLKYYFYTFVVIIQRHLCHEGSRMYDYNINK
jgi:hypothetical protein